MTRIKVSELSGIELDSVVAWCLGFKYYTNLGRVMIQRSPGRDYEPFRPSTDWNDCGPLIELFSIRLIPPEISWESVPCWGAYVKKRGSPRGDMLRERVCELESEVSRLNGVIANRDALERRRRMLRGEGM